MYDLSWQTKYSLKCSLFIYALIQVLFQGFILLLFSTQG